MFFKLKFSWAAKAKFSKLMTLGLILAVSWSILYAFDKNILFWNWFWIELFVAWNPFIQFYTEVIRIEWVHPFQHATGLIEKLLHCCGSFRNCSSLVGSKQAKKNTCFGQVNRGCPGSLRMSVWKGRAWCWLFATFLTLNIEYILSIIIIHSFASSSSHTQTQSFSLSIVLALLMCHPFISLHFFLRFSNFVANYSSFFFTLLSIIMAIFCHLCHPLTLNAFVLYWAYKYRRIPGSVYSFNNELLCKNFRFFKVQKSINSTHSHVDVTEFGAIIWCIFCTVFSKFIMVITKRSDLFGINSRNKRLLV